MKLKWNILAAALALLLTQPLAAYADELVSDASEPSAMTFQVDFPAEPLRPGAQFSPVIDVFNNTGTAYDVVLHVSFYDGLRLLSVKTFLYNTSLPVSSFLMDETVPASTTSAKIMVWEAETLRPLGKAVEIWALSPTEEIMFLNVSEGKIYNVVVNGSAMILQYNEAVLQPIDHPSASGSITTNAGSVRFQALKTDATAITFIQS